jgi:hypothetical protein
MKMSKIQTQEIILELLVATEVYLKINVIWYVTL